MAYITYQKFLNDFKNGVFSEYLSNHRINEIPDEKKITINTDKKVEEVKVPAANQPVQKKKQKKHYYRRRKKTNSFNNNYPIFANDKKGGGNKKIKV